MTALGIFKAASLFIGLLVASISLSILILGFLLVLLAVMQDSWDDFKKWADEYSVKHWC